MYYRPDIDGLRAIAVLAVVAYHADPQIIPGGFTGVDIFFAISGYLITLNIASDLTAGQFSLTEFYRRRVKRIMPVMLTVVSCVLLAGYFILIPEDLQALAKSAVWSLASMANVYFWHEVDTGYFAPASAQMPLLHLWSLGVEEQFYLLWPLLLLLIWKVARATTISVLTHRIALGFALVVIAISVAFAEYGHAQNGRFVFYMLPSRAAELLLGSIAAIWVLTRPPTAGQAARSHVLAWCGALLVVASLTVLSDADPFPGWRALLPTTGTVLLILAGGARTASPITRGLSWAPLVWIGKLSYSLYLWHWPVFAYWRYVYGEPSWTTSLALVLLTFALAQLSYTSIECKTRRSTKSVSNVLFFQFILPSSAILTFALVLVFGDRMGFPTHAPSYLSQLAQLRNSVEPGTKFPWICQRQRLSPADLDDPSCVLGLSSETPPRVLFWGDSNAAHYVPMMEILAKNGGFAFRNFSIGSCPPIRGEIGRFVSAARQTDCSESLRLAWSNTANFPYVILGASWTTYEARADDFFSRLEASVRVLTERGQKVLLLAKTTQLLDYDGRCVEKALKLKFLACTQKSQPLPDEVRLVNSKLQELAARVPGLSYYDTNVYLCPSESCPIHDPQGLPIYFDANHLTVKASHTLGVDIIAKDATPEMLRQISP